MQQLPNVHQSPFNRVPMSDWEETEYLPNAQSTIVVLHAHRVHPLLIASQSNNCERANKNGKHPLTWCNVMWTRHLNTGPRALYLYN